MANSRRTVLFYAIFTFCFFFSIFEKRFSLLLTLARKNLLNLEKRVCLVSRVLIGSHKLSSCILTGENRRYKLTLKQRRCRDQTRRRLLLLLQQRNQNQTHKGVRDGEGAGPHALV